MAETSVSLLERLRVAPDDDGWKRLVDLYAPLVHSWLRRNGLQPQDADDVVQDVLGVVVRELSHFEHGRTGAFRAWLRAITANRLRGFWRARQARPLASGDSDIAQLLEQLADADSGLSRRWDEEHDRHVIQRLMQLLEPEFAATAWKAFRRQVIDGERASVVAAELGVSVNVVLLAKSRILRRLRQEARGLVD